jgi:formylglycine-generating enzyme required for sulfatase activity
MWDPSPVFPQSPTGAPTIEELEKQLEAKKATQRKSAPLHPSDPAAEIVAKIQSRMVNIPGGEFLMSSRKFR